MPLNLRANILINAPASRLFELICSPERLPEWNVSVQSARRVAAEEPVQRGSRAIFSGRLLGQSLESETEVVEFDPPHRFSTLAVRGPRLTTRFELRPEGDATRVGVEVSGDVPGGALGARLAEGFIRKELSASLARLRTICEAESALPR